MNVKEYTVDSALAQPLKPGIVNPAILGIGQVLGTALPKLGVAVQKSGRSTAVTRGRITLLDATVIVGFSGGRKARFTGQVITTKMGEPGDSGSLLLDGANRAIGLLFAGSSHATLFNPITDVLDSLNVDFGTETVADGGSRDNYLADLRSLCRLKADALLSLPNVVGVGIGPKITGGVDSGEVCLVVLVKQKVAREMMREEEMVPRFVEEIRTDVFESGELEAINKHTWYGRPQNRRQKLRPARPGLSIAHHLVSAGTFGAVVYDRDSGDPLILSNNHVLANATDGKDGLSTPGDPILQPGKHDGGLNPHDIIGTLLRFTPLRFL